MQRVMYFTKASLLVDLSNKLSAEMNSDQIEEKNKKPFQELSKAIHDLSEKIISKCFAKGEYEKCLITEAIQLHKSRYTVPAGGKQLKQSIIMTLEKIFEILDDEKTGLKNTKKVFLDTGTVNELSKTDFKQIKSVSNKIEKTILSLQ